MRSRTSAVRRWAAVALAAAVLTGCSSDGSPEKEVDPPVAAEELLIPADGLELSGTLRLPEADGPAPVVVIVHGSGPLDRDGWLPGQLGFTLPQPVPAYLELAEALQERGYATFTWDKRTCGSFNGCADNDYPTPSDDLTIDTLRDDVGAVLDVLGARDDIGDIVLVGHSKGGTIATGLLAERDDIAGLVLLATPSGPLPELMAAQAEKFAELAADAGQTADQAIAGLQELADDVAEVADGEVEGPPISGASRAFWASWIQASLDAPDQVAASDVPVLALGGEHDWNVPPEQVRAWEPHLGAGGTVEILPEITHALTRLGTEDAAALTAEDVGLHVDPSVIDALITWLADTLPS